MSTETQKSANTPGEAGLTIPPSKWPDNVLLLRASKNPDNVAELLQEIERRGLELELHNTLARCRRFIVIPGGAS